MISPYCFCEESVYLLSQRKYDRNDQNRFHQMKRNAEINYSAVKKKKSPDKFFNHCNTQFLVLSCGVPFLEQ